MPLSALLARAVPSFLPFPSAKQDPDSYWRDQQKLLSRLGTRVLVTYEDNLPAIHQHVDTSTLALTYSARSGLRRVRARTDL